VSTVLQWWPIRGHPGSADPSVPARLDGGACYCQQGHPSRPRRYGGMGYLHSYFVLGALFSGYVTTSDNFSFQNNGIKKCTCWKTMGFFKQCFWHDFTHDLFWLHCIKHMHFIKIKTIHVLHKISFHNTIPHRSHSLIGHVIQELW